MIPRDKVEEKDFAWHLRVTEDPWRTLERSVSSVMRRTIGAWCTWRIIGVYLRKVLR